MDQRGPGKKTSGYYRDEFGRLARYYDAGLRFGMRFVGGEEAFRREIIRAAGLRPGHMVLDVDCGTGTLAMMMAPEVVPEGRVVGIDLSEEMIGMANRKIDGEPVEFLVANAEDLPFPDSSFDRVTISLSYHEMNREGRMNTLAEIKRVLKRNGKLVIADLRPPDTVYSRIGMFFLTWWEADTLTDLWERGISRELEDAGLVETGHTVTGRRFFEIVVAGK